MEKCRNRNESENSGGKELSAEDLVSIINAYRERHFTEELEEIERLGGLDNFQSLLKISFERGLKGDDFAERAAKFGDNRRPEPKKMSFLEFCLEAMKDKIMIILLSLGSLLLVAEMLMGSNPSRDWMEGFAIVFAVIVVVFVTGINDYQKEKKFIELQAMQTMRFRSEVLRNGVIESLHPSELMVGDIVQLSDGTVIPGDGILINAESVEIDESAMTGENERRKKAGFAECIKLRTQYLKDNPDLVVPDNDSLVYEIPSCVCLSGTTLVEGRGKLLITAVGRMSAVGFILDSAQEAPGQTPLEEKLEKIADLISKIGLACGFIAAIFLIIRMIIEVSIGFKDFDEDIIFDLIHYFILGVTVLVVAIPEGLPLAVTISLAYSVSKMQKEHNLVKRLVACETMGGADVICSDKTGTLTQNSMRAQQYWFDCSQIPVGGSLNIAQHSEYFARLKEGICVSTHARIENQEEFGSKTEIALLRMLMDFGHADYTSVRTRIFQKPHKAFPFSSTRKRSSMIVTTGEQQTRGYVIGASEIVSERCNSYLTRDGDSRPISNEIRLQIHNAIEEMARTGLRTVALAYRDLPAGADWEALDATGSPAVEGPGLTCLGVVGIADPIRPGVSDAVRTCKQAFIDVKMVTGDNKITARAIANECGILTSDTGVMEGRELYDRVGGIVCKNCRTNKCPCPKVETRGQQTRVDVVADLEEFQRAVDNLDVLARSQPEHKYLLVTGLMQLGRVVAVTGDGTNDAPALKKADVGFAMGLSGTEHAREAADIILLNDDFSSIVNATKWGRNIYDSIQKFIQFQLTVNVVAVTAAIVGAVVIKQSPLTTVQMLWVNLIMDTFASLALATEPPTDELLLRRPHTRDESIVTRTMWKHILGQAVLQCSVIYVMIFAGEHFLIEDADESTTVLKDGDYVISGRFYSISGEKEYKELYDDSDGDIGPSRHFTIIFNTFVLFQLFNEFNARMLKEKLWVFYGIHRNYMFLGIWIFTFVVQFVIVNFSGNAASCHLDGLTFLQWLICIAIGSTSLFWRILLVVCIPSSAFRRLETKDNESRVQRLTSSIRRENSVSSRVPHTKS